MLNKIQVVVFCLGNSYFGVNIYKVQEIIKTPKITEVPNTPDFIIGVVNLRGKVIPIMDLNKKFQIGNNRAEIGNIVVLKKGKDNYGILVDRIAEVEKIEESILEPPPNLFSGIKKEYIEGIAKLEEKLLIVLDVEKILEVKGY